MRHATLTSNPPNMELHVSSLVNNHDISFRLQKFLQCAEEMMQNVPQFWSYIAEVMSKCLSARCSYIAENLKPRQELEL
jgi:hypothetical protein